MNISFWESLLLKEISKSHLEIIKDNDPDIIYINDIGTLKKDEWYVLEKFISMDLIQCTEKSSYKEVYKITEKGNMKLIEFRIPS